MLSASSSISSEHLHAIRISERDIVPSVVSLVRIPSASASGEPEYGGTTVILSATGSRAFALSPGGGSCRVLHGFAGTADSLAGVEPRDETNAYCTSLPTP